MDFDGYKINVCWDQVQDIVKKELAHDFKSVLNDIELVKATNKGFAFSLDPEEDKEELTMIAMALMVVLDYYGGFDNVG